MRLSSPEAPLADETIVLREWADADVPAIVSACDDAEIARWLDQVPQPYGLEDAHAYIGACRRGWAEGTSANFAVVDPADGKVLGSLGLRLADLPDGVAEAGYWVAREARGRGVATHALRLAVRWLLGEPGIERVQLRADTLNMGSQRVAEKAGFTREGVLRSMHYNPRLGRRIDFVMFSLLPGELP